MTKKDLYDQWNTKTLGGSTKLSVVNFDLIQDGIHVEAANEPSLELVNLVGQATNTQSQSGPMPGTMKIVTADGGTDQNTIVGVYSPDENEVWQVLDIAATRDGSGTVNYYVGYWDGVSTSVSDGWIPIFDHSSTDGQVQFDDWPGTTAFIDSKITIGMYFTTSATVNAMTYKAAVVRVR